ncbi:MAG: hypothetical protein AAFZ09_05745 [Pseudomonadota bacterium]
MTRILPIALVAVLACAGTASAQVSEAAKEQAVANFMQADANADSALTKGEFVTLIDLNAQSGIGRATMIQRFNRYDMAFGRIDANGDGLVTPEEMQALAQTRQ